jgi:malic enzyme
VGADLAPEKVVPDPTEKKMLLKVASNVAAAVAGAAIKTGVAGINRDLKEIKAETRQRIKEYWKMEGKILR